MFNFRNSVSKHSVLMDSLFMKIQFFGPNNKWALFIVTILVLEKKQYYVAKIILFTISRYSVIKAKSVSRDLIEFFNASIEAKIFIILLLLLLTVISDSISSCLKTNKCPGLCVMTPEGAKCLCADGLIAKNCIRAYENNTLIGCAKGKRQN